MIAGWRTIDDTEIDVAVPGAPHDRVTLIDVRRLSIDSVDRLLRDRLGLELARPALVRLHAVAGGNPFYAIELGRAIGQGAAPDGDPDVLRVPRSLDALVADRLARLDPEAETTVLFAAAAAQPTVDLLAAAMDRRSSAGTRLGPKRPGSSSWRRTRSVSPIPSLRPRPTRARPRRVAGRSTVAWPRSRPTQRSVLATWHAR